MPQLDTKLHLDMYRRGQRQRSISHRLKAAVDALFARNNVYGLEWGDPETLPPLRYVREHFLMPYISSRTTLVEIGPGGGRWTRYMLNARRIYAVDYYQALLDELKSNVHASNISFIKNNGTDFPGVPDGSVDFIFSFGCFVHLDTNIINDYLMNMKRLLHGDSNVVIHYSDNTKPIARSTKSFSDNNPDIMRDLVLSNGYEVYEEDVKTMWHSSIVRFGLPKQLNSPIRA